jgi:hypothetical protein
MNSPNDKEHELKRFEQEIRKREQALRLRELEAEINPPPLYQTVKHEQPEGKLQEWGKKFVKLGKFLGMVLVVVVTMQIGIKLAYVLVIGVISWVAYQIFFHEDRSKH